MGSVQVKFQCVLETSRLFFGLRETTRLNFRPWSSAGNCDFLSAELPLITGSGSACRIIASLRQELKAREQWTSTAALSTSVPEIKGMPGCRLTTFTVQLFGGVCVSNILELKNVTFDYILNGENTLRALDDISLEIRKGEYIALIGSNGSGKSTLARLLNAILQPTSGEVWVDGLLTSREEYRWEIRRRVGMVFQNPDNQIVATTVEEDVAFGLENLGIDSSLISRRVTEALEQVGLSFFSQHAPHLLSGGQKQRLAIAGILAMRPRCLVLDEPTAMLDPRGRREVMETVRKMNRQEGITVVHITHFMEETLDADRIIVMYKGKIVGSGKPVEIFSGKTDLCRLGLEVPVLPRLISILRSGGLDVPEKVLNINDLVNFLC